ncbi:DISARM anti-phage system protein DrmE domain-containing protein [Streptomyces violascens]|uniref:DISARM anti-phage system protein DrmE domain-containing protein n=1 Tax=Streptomyces violascens TaxID=67381 RepID=UPI0036623A93
MARVTYLDCLVPPDAGPADFFERVQALRMTDRGRTVDLGPLDRATLTLLLRALSSDQRSVYLGLPRGRHDLAVLIGIYLQLIRRGAALTGGSPCPVPDGPVVVVGLRTNVTVRLAQLAIGRQNLSRALRMQRIRGDGQVVDLQGKITRAVDSPSGLFYLNTALGRPSLGTSVGTVVIDRTSMANDQSWERALAWASEHDAARVVAVADLGTQPGSGRAWTQWPWTPALRADVRHTLGHRPAYGPLTSNALLAHRPAATPSVAIYRHEQLAELHRTVVAGVVAARRVHTSESWPQPIADAVRLLNLLWCSWGSIGKQDAWQVLMGHGRGARALARSVSGGTLEGRAGPWGLFRETQWPDLRRGVLDLYELLYDGNPRRDLLLALIAWARADRAGVPILVRSRSRSAAAAVAEELADELGSDADSLLLAPRPGPAASRGASALHVIPYSERLAWNASPRLELHLGVPSTLRTGVLFSGAADEHVAVVEQSEYTWLERSAGRALHGWHEQIRQTAAGLRLGGVPEPVTPPLPVAYGPVDLSGPSSASGEPPQRDSRLTLDLSALFEDYDGSVRAIGTPADPGRSATAAANDPVPTTAVVTEPDGAVLWLRADEQVDVLIGQRYARVPVTALTPGSRLLRARGDGQSRLHDRLVMVMHDSAEVTAMDTMIGFFRQAITAVHEQRGSWPDVLTALKNLGSEVSSWQAVSKWADGSVIAPEDPQDIHRVALLARDTRLTAGGTWQRLARMAEELRRLHRALGHTAAAAMTEAARGTEGPALRQLKTLCSGIDVSEVLEEFDLVVVRRLGGQKSVSAAALGRVPGPRSTSNSPQEAP